MSFEVHPILDPGHVPARDTWYAVAPEGKQPSGGSGVQVIEDQGCGPCPRVGACANFIQRGDRVGGVLLSAGATPEGPFSDLHELTLEKDKIEWKSLSSEGLPAKYEHAAFVAGQSDKSVSSNWLYVFAGAKPDGPVNNMWRISLNPPRGVWEEIKCSSTIPIPRTFHSSSCIMVNEDGTSLIVFSGGESGMSPVGDRKTYLFNHKSCKWSVLKTSGSPPSPRQGHVTAVVGDMLFVHGGMAGQEVYSDLYTLNLKTLQWTCPQVRGTPPPPLAAHGCAVIGQMLYVFGGLSTSPPGAQDALYSLNTETLTWRHVKVSGAPPPSRLDHAMCAISIPIPSSPQTPQDKPTKPTTLSSVHRTQQSSSGGSLSTESSQSSCVEAAALQSGDTSVSTSSGFQAVTVIDAEDSSSTNFTISQSSECSEHVNGDEVAGKLQGLQVEEKEKESSGQCEWVPGVFVFGGMDTTGIVHGDAFILVPS